MLCINSENTDPCFNLASEEYFLRFSDADVFLLYRNIPSIVVGKHQNTLAEINLSYVQEKGIRVARRISGGGAVFHDLGNINFAFITSGREGELVNYRKFTRPMIDALGRMGLEVHLGARNELLLGDLKISGTASHVYKRRVLHHGTLLFSSDLGALSDALNVPAGQFSDRGVKSIPSKVTNISDHLGGSMKATDFQSRLMEHVLNSAVSPRPRTYIYGDQDLREITKLCQSKFSTWEWNFGYSPKYQFRRKISFGEGTLELQVHVEKGIIRSIAIGGDYFSGFPVPGLEEMIVGCNHDLRSLRKRLAGIRVGAYIRGLENEELLSALF